MADYIKNNTQEEQTNILAQYLRDDALHEAKNITGSNLRKLLLGLAVGFQDVNNNLNIAFKEGNIKEATSLIELWEELFGIPDDCLSNTGTLEERRNNILIKLAGLQGSLVEQFEYVLNLLGYSGSIIETGISKIIYPLTYPILYLSSNEEALFTMVVTLPLSLQPATYPLTYPILYSGDLNTIQCIFNKLKPANVQIYYIFGGV